jgi:hypothetical protein
MYASFSTHTHTQVNYDAWLKRLARFASFYQDFDGTARCFEARVLMQSISSTNKSDHFKHRVFLPQTHKNHFGGSSISDAFIIRQTYLRMLYSSPLFSRLL